MLMIPEETVINIAIFCKTTPFSDTSSWLDPFYIMFVWLRNKYPPVTRHGLLENHQIKLDEFPRYKPPFIGDFPASHVWLPKGNDYKTMYLGQTAIQSLFITLNVGLKNMIYVTLHDNKCT